MCIITNDTEVQTISTFLLPAVMINIFAGIAVEVGTGGVLTSQGRPKMVTFLSMGFELPLSLGSVALLVLAFHASLLEVYWVQSAVTCLEAVVVWFIITRSNWSKHAAEAQVRQNQSSPIAGMASPNAMRSPSAFDIASPHMPDEMNAARTPPQDLEMHHSPALRGA